LKQTLEKIYASLGKGDVRDILEKFPQEKRCAVAQILQTRLTCERELQEIRAHIAQEREEQRDMFEKVRVKALAVMHPDVTIKCFKGYFRSTKTLQAPTIVYDLAQDQLVLA
jgi:Mg/Co/Ni transporter MgtE